MPDQSHQPADRRPIATRERKWSQRLASWLAGRGVSANAISMFGLIAGLAAGSAFAATNVSAAPERFLWIAGGVLVQLRLLANMLDGMVAVRSETASPIGELYNEVPDRVADVAILVGLGYAMGGNPLLGYCAAMAALFTAYVRAMAKVAGAPQDFCGPLAKPQRMFLITLCAAYQAFTPIAWQPAWTSIGNLELENPAGIPAATLLVIAAGALFTAARRLVRAAHHLKKITP